MSRVLCVCNNGNVRSITLARILKSRGHQVLTFGAQDFYKGNDEDIGVALAMCLWADIIFVQKDSEKYLLHILTERTNGSDLTSKIDARFDVGPDDWKVPMHPDLLSYMRKLVEGDLVWNVANR